jgi:hypothetical protein
MKYRLMSMLLVIGLLACSKDDPQEERYFIDTWEIVALRTANQGNLMKEVEAVDGTIRFKGVRNKAKRGTYEYTFTEDGSSKELKGDFIWWLTEDQNKKNRRIQMSMEEFEQPMLGLGNVNFGNHPDFEIVDNSRMFMTITLSETTNRPHKQYEYELRRR